MCTENKLRVFLDRNNCAFVEPNPSNLILIFCLLLYLCMLFICLCLRKH